MKKFFLSILFLAIGFGTLHADNYDDARSNAYTAALYLTAAGYNIKGYKGEYLGTSETVTYKVYMYSGNQYVVLGAGDNRVGDLDVEVYDSNGNLVASDRDYSAVSVAKFTPAYSGTYYVRTRMYSGNGYFFQMVGWR